MYAKEYRKRKQVTENLAPSGQSIEAKQKKKMYAKEYRKHKRVTESLQPSRQSLEAKEKKKMYGREYRKRKQASEILEYSARCEVKQKRRSYRKEYGKQKYCEFVPIESLISKFHDVVSEGPLYICTCCDQLWYNHSVIPASTLKENNPDLQKILLNRKSVNNVEWLCRT